MVSGGKAVVARFDMDNACTYHELGPAHSPANGMSFRPAGPRLRIWVVDEKRRYSRCSALRYVDPLPMPEIAATKELAAPMAVEIIHAKPAYGELGFAASWMVVSRHLHCLCPRDLVCHPHLRVLPLRRK